MKKLFGLLVIGSVGMFIACTSDDSDPLNGYSDALGYCTGGLVQKTDPETFQPLYNADGSPICVAPSTTPASSSSADQSALLPTMSSSSNTGLVPATPASSSSIGIVPAASSSSVAPVAASSSSVAQTTPVAKSSSSKKETTPTVNEDVDDGTFKLGLWDGTAGDGQVPTGNKQGGYWYSYNDKDNGGKSSVTWCSAAGSEYGDDDLAPVIKENGGLCGTIDLVVGTNEYKPYLGIGFNYGKSGSLTGDATASKGVCISYTSEIPIKLVLGLGTSVDNKLGGANPYVDLPAGTKTQEFTWAEFGQPDWAKMEVSGKEAAASLGSITLKFEGDTDGEDGEGGSFLIKKLGALGQCD